LAQHHLRHSQDDTSKTIAQDATVRSERRGSGGDPPRFAQGTGHASHEHGCRSVQAPVAKPRQRTATACRALISAFAAISILSTNIFLPSLPAIAANLRVSSAAVHLHHHGVPRLQR